MLRLIMALLMFLIIGCGTGCSQTKDYDQFAPDNDLWKYDNLAQENSTIDERLFNDIVRAGKEAYQYMAEQRNEELVINPLWSDKTVNANACRGCVKGKAIVNMFGGLARRREILPESFALVLCHEIGHLYGGKPYIDVAFEMSAEGQSDYWSTNVCFDKVYKIVPELRAEHDKYQPYTEKCGGIRRCMNSLEGGQGLGNLLGFMTGADELPRYETPDPTVVTRTEVSYPRTVQCRLDTYAAGTFMWPRPACWFKESRAAFRW